MASKGEQSMRSTEKKTLMTLIGLLLGDYVLVGRQKAFFLLVGFQNSLVRSKTFFSLTIIHSQWSNRNRKQKNSGSFDGSSDCLGGHVTTQFCFYGRKCPPKLFKVRKKRIYLSCAEFTRLIKSLNME